MTVYRERCFFGHAKLELEVRADGGYRLAWNDELVYENGVRSVRGRRQPYRFRSVEQLRYDFEQDVRALGGSLG